MPAIIGALAPLAIGGLLGAMFAKRGGKQGQTPQQTTPTPEQRLEPVGGAVGELAEAGQADIAGQTAANIANQQRAQREAAEAKIGQAEAGLGFDISDYAAQTGLEDIRAEIDKTRQDIETLPEDVQQQFDEQQQKLDAGLEEARAGIGEQRTEALAGVMQGRSQAIDAAVSSIHGAINQQISNIDAQVQQGVLSPSQAQMMKHKIKMGGAMQLSAAVGQTAHMFTQTQAQVATSFGNMFTQFESTAAQVEGAFGATAAGAFAQAQTDKARFNTELTKLDAQATSQRDAILSQNAASRAAFQNANDTHNMAMLDYTQDKYVMTTPVAINNLQGLQELARDLIKSDMFQAELELLQKNMNLTNQGNLFNIIASVLQFV